MTPRAAAASTSRRLSHATAGSAGRQGRRRTQEERRAATRQALLDASLACLLEDGYAGLSTRRVAARAGLSPATQRFYFPTRAEFVAAAVERLAIELLEQQREHPLRRAAAPRRFQAWLDELWTICQGPAFQVIAELSAAARTDRDARDSLARVERVLARQIARSAADLFGEQMTDPRFRVLVDLATSTMRGLAMFLPISTEEALQARWQAVRAPLLGLFRDLIEKPA